MLWIVFKVVELSVLFHPPGYVRDTNFAKKNHTKKNITNLLHLSLFFNCVKNEDKVKLNVNHQFIYSTIKIGTL